MAVANFKNIAPKMIILLYFSIVGFMSGLPFVLFTDTLQAWYASQGLSAVMISLMVFLTIPYTLKPLTATWIDRLHSKTRISYMRFYTLCSLLLTPIFVALAFSNTKSMHLQLAVAIVGCLISSGFDIAADAHRMLATTSDDQQAFVSNAFVASYRASWILGGGVGLIWAEYYSWQTMYLCMAGIYALAQALIISIAIHYPELTNQMPSSEPKHTSQWDDVHEIRRWLCAPNTLFVLTLIMLLKCHESLIKPSLATYLVQSAGMSLSSMGFWYKTIGFWTTLAGGAACGFALRRFGKRNTLLWLCLLELCASVLLALSCLYTQGYYPIPTGPRLLPLHTLLVLCITLECFCFGAVTAGVMVLAYSVIDPKHAGCQYAAVTSLLAFQRLALAPVAAFALSYGGWPIFWSVSFGLATLSTLSMVLFTSRSQNEATNPLYYPPN
jgi:PAT family beta-lactamase induction signal transducer AmpG